MTHQHFWGFSGDRQKIIFCVNLGLFTLSKLTINRKNKLCFEGFNTHLWGFSGNRCENIHFLCKPRHVTPQIDYLRKTSTVLRVSTHIYGVSQEIDVKTFIFRVNLGM